MPKRIEKVNELIKKYLSEILLRNLDLKSGVFVTIAKVDTTPDLRYTRVFVSVFPEKDTEYVLKTFNKEIYKIQGFLNRKLAMKPLPRIEFRVDVTEAKADEIEKLFREIYPRSEK